MAFDDFFRLSAHAVFTNNQGRVLLLKATYAELRWGLPGGSIDPGETVHETLVRECKEELGVDIKILYMSGIYFHHIHNTHACVFRCEMPKDSPIILSTEHSEYRYFSLEEMNEVQRQRVQDCLQFDGTIKSAKF
ncbi:MAG: NUDIX hydrolase [Gammaproteobacteria bacterium RIFCSPHIGHO2_12_FULL_41_20]|nr:MAG: NUDIX hydrolase [Gammaproteobacteria bacterium RIFCSPHIGHO2_12_FULL_41_20]